MAQYKVVVGVRPRSSASMSTSDTAANVPAGTIINSSISQVDAITASHPVMIQVADGAWAGKWLPLVYAGVTYVVEIIATPPPTTTGEKPFVLSVVGFKPFVGTLIPEA